jgi:hypothetical protein
MVEQTRITDPVAQKLANQLLEAQGRAERDEVLDNVRDSNQAQHARDTVDEDRLTEKVESVLKNERIGDQVHISDRAQKLYRAREMELKGVPERAHVRAQEGTERPGPFSKQGSLGNLEQEE